MKFYVVMGRYLCTQDQAKAHAKQHGAVFLPNADVEDVPAKQSELADYLNNLVQNSFAVGRAAVPVGEQPRAAEQGTPAPYTAQSVDLDEAFQRIPATHQLTLATLALENAQTEIARLRKLARLDAPAPAPEPPDVDDLI